MTKPEFMSWFNLHSDSYERYKNMPLGQATVIDQKRKAKCAANRRTSDYEELQRFLMQALEDNPLDDFVDLHQKALDAGFEISYVKSRRALMDLGVKIRNRPAEHWYGLEGIEVFKERWLSYAGDHKDDNPEGIYFIDESIVRCTHRKKRQLCKKGQAPTPNEQTRYTAQCHVLGVIGHGGFRVFVNVTELLAKKRKERLEALKRRREQQNGGAAEVENDNFKYGFRAVDYQKVLDAHIIAPIRQHKRRINDGRRPEDRVEPVLVQDRAPSHWAKDTLDYLEDAGVRIHHHWPRYSPDLNPIENVWGWLVVDLATELYEHRQNTAENCRKVWEIVSAKFHSFLDQRISGKLPPPFAAGHRCCRG